MGAPLMLSHASYTAQVFVDRLLLTWYGTDAMAGQVTGVFFTLSLVGVFISIGEYLTTFVAQYHGAGQPRSIGLAMGQGLIFAVLSGVLLAGVAPFVRPFFEGTGHSPALVEAEVTYSRTLLLGAFVSILLPTLSSFFAGIGRVGVVLGVTVLVNVLNIVLDSLLIFGNLGFPEWGVFGAAVDNVISQGIGCAVLLWILLKKENRERYGLSNLVRFDGPLFRKLLRFGTPAGLHFSVELFAFSIFMILVGRLGTDALAASGISFNLNMIVFMPMLGMGIAVSALVGRYVGARKPESAERATWTAAGLSFGYMVACGLVYVLFPRALLAPYALRADPVEFAAIEEIAVVLLRFVALYSIFDVMNVIFSSAVKGAGDTRFPLYAATLAGLFVLVLPTWFVTTHLGGGWLAAFWCATAYVAAVGIAMLVRFRAGKWKRMSVIGIESGSSTV